MLFNKYIPQSLCQEQDDCVIFVDSNWQDRTSYARLDGFVECTVPNSRKAFNAKCISSNWGIIVPNAVHPRGLDGVSQSLPLRNQSLAEVFSEILAEPANRKAGIPQLLQELLNRQYPVRVLYTVGHWFDINSLDDVVQAGNF